MVNSNSISGGDRTSNSSFRSGIRVVVIALGVVIAVIAEVVVMVAVVVVVFETGKRAFELFSAAEVRFKDTDG